ncbi:hypothetical protein [Novosphingobium sp. FKTRR1]|uniref:hypothetical protein n=1 Tax=Novosphingobium sp. FKTRR1 TaxID=2879118 RepID=UPI001CF01ED9|nr:hypothetical protein [Novosphingobium sp. FKTRR1]
MSEPVDPAVSPAAAPAASPAPVSATIPASPLERSEPAPAAAPAAAAASWMDTLPDDLKGDKTLARFKSVEDLAKGVVERQAMLGDRIQLPKADDPDSFERFAAAIRPEKPDAYKIEVPEGQDATFAESMRPVFHDAGLHPLQVEKLVAANNTYVAQQAAAIKAAGKKELADLEAGMGTQEFAAAKLATNAWLTRMGIPVKFDTDLARLVGAGNSVRLLFDIVRRTGELGKVNDSEMALAMGTMTPEQAKVEASKLDAKALRNPSSPESKKMDEYAAVIARGTSKR